MHLFDLECRTPRWSPDGGWIAFAGRRNGLEKIYLVRPNGSALRQLTTDASQETQPAWSRDGRLAYVVSDRQGPHVKVVGPLRGARTSSHTVLLREVTATSPAWSPDGKCLALVMERDGVRRIHVVDLKRGEVKELSSGLGNSLHPTWSPDGRQIAFISDREGTYRLFVMNVDGSEERRLADVIAAAPCWSPRGSTIAYEGTVESRSPYGPKPVGICLLDVGDGTTRAVQSAALGHSPDWSPDSSQIVFSRNFCLWVLNVADETAAPLGDEE
ncbi:MAG: TolB family protein [Candidatus Zipacnadales bacterium]